MSKLEEEFLFQVKAIKLPIPEREYRFGAMASGGTGNGLRKRLAEHGLRDWRFDFAYPDLKIAVEVEGGTFSGGRHTRGKGFEGDVEKYTSATLLGWLVIRATGKHVKSGQAVQWLQQAIDMDVVERWCEPFQEKSEEVSWDAVAGSAVGDY